MKALHKRIIVLQISSGFLTKRIYQWMFIAISCMLHSEQMNESLRDLIPTRSKVSSLDAHKLQFEEMSNNSSPCCVRPSSSWRLYRLATNFGISSWCLLSCFSSAHWFNVNIIILPSNDLLNISHQWLWFFISFTANALSDHHIAQRWWYHRRKHRESTIEEARWKDEDKSLQYFDT